MLIDETALTRWLASALPGDVLEYLLFGEEPSSPPLPVSYSELVRRLREKMNAGNLSVDQMGDIVNLELPEYLQDPDRLAELPIAAVRAICQVVGVDWLATLTQHESS